MKERDRGGSREGERERGSGRKREKERDRERQSIYWDESSLLRL